MILAGAASVSDSAWRTVLVGKAPLIAQKAAGSVRVSAQGSGRGLGYVGL